MHLGTQHGRTGSKRRGGNKPALFLPVDGVDGKLNENRRAGEIPPPLRLFKLGQPGVAEKPSLEVGSAFFTLGENGPVGTEVRLKLGDAAAFLTGFSGR